MFAVLTFSSTESILALKQFEFYPKEAKTMTIMNRVNHSIIAFAVCAIIG